MNLQPDHRTPLPPESWQRHTPYASHVSAPPKTWFGKLIVGVVGAVVMLATLFLSIVVFAVLTSILLLGVVYIFWTARQARREKQRQTIDMP